MSASHFILLVGSDPTRTEALAAQLVGLGVEPIRATDLLEAVTTIEGGAYLISAVLLPSDVPGRHVAEAMERMRRSEPMLPAMAYGKVPDARQAAALRGAGIRLALWDGWDRGVLRFQLNRLVSGEEMQAIRNGERAPVHVPVRIRVGGREKQGVLYSLSHGGCFVETPRASMEGARVELAFDLAGQSYSLASLVLFSNVPGNLQRPNLPLGMGVRFIEVHPVAAEHLEAFIEERTRSLEI